MMFLGFIDDMNAENATSFFVLDLLCITEFIVEIIYLMDGMIYASIMYFVPAEVDQLLQLHLLDLHYHV